MASLFTLRKQLVIAHLPLFVDAVNDPPGIRLLSFDWSDVQFHGKLTRLTVIRMNGEFADPDAVPGLRQRGTCVLALIKGDAKHVQCRANELDEHESSELHL